MTCSFNPLRILIKKQHVKALAGLVVFILLLHPAETAALEPSLEVTQYAHTGWTTQGGALRGAVRAITQTPDGYLWLGTEFGVVRFDGVRFAPWNPPAGQLLPSTNIRSLIAARDGTLWIGTLEGLASWKDGKLNQYTELAQQNVLTLLEDKEGTVWAGTFRVPKGKLCAIKHGKAECYGEDGSLGQWVWSLCEDGKGRIWAGAETGLWRWKAGPVKRYGMPRVIETSQALVEGEKPGELFAISDGVWRFKNEKIEPYQIATPPGRFSLMNMLRDHDGGLWLGTLQRGLFHVHKGKTDVFGEGNGLSSNRVLSLFEDREHNIWVGTADGLDRFRETTAVSISVKQGLSNPSVEAVLPGRDHSVWLSTLDGLNRWNNGEVTIYWPGGRGGSESARLHATEQTRSAFYIPAKEAVREIGDPGMPDYRPGSLYEDDRGRVWVSTPKGIARFENGRFSVVREVPAGWVNAITGDGRAGIWISYQDLGLVHWVEGKVVERVPWSKLGGNVVASSVMPDPVRGGLWLGFFQGGLLHFKDGQIYKSYGSKEGLGSGRVMDLRLDADGTVWAATEGGLSRVKDGRVLTLTSKNGMGCDTVHWAVEIDAAFWLYTPCGLLRVERSELEKWAADPVRSLQFAVFGRSDGVRSRPLLTGYTPRVSKSADGRLWFADLESVSVIDPRHLIRNEIAPLVHIEHITADDKTYETSDGLRLSPLVRNLAFDFAALSLVAPEKNQYRFKLEGWDRDWREAVNQFRVEYSNLPPQHYKFRVIASNNSGVWNEEGASLDFVIPPAWYQTNWFRASCVAGFLGLLWGLYLLRLHRLAREFHMAVEARVGERTRIARELHDTLLQSFHGLMFEFQAARNMFSKDPQQALRTLDEAIAATEHAITESRDVIQDLRSEAARHRDVAESLAETGRALAATYHENGTAPRLRMIAEGERQNLSAAIEDDVFRIASEVLRNAFRHARAQHIEIEIRYDRQEFHLCIRDDGKGIAPAVLAKGGVAGHWGLAGIRERARQIGAQLRVWSEAGAGTEVQLTIPASVAYEKRVEGSRFKLLGKAKSHDQRP